MVVDITDLSSVEFLNEGSGIYASWNFVVVWIMVDGGAELRDKIRLLSSIHK